MGGGSSSPSTPTDCICSTRFCKYNRSEGISDPKTPSEPEKLDAISEATDAVADFMKNNSNTLYEQTKHNLEISADQVTEGTITCLSTNGIYTSTTDKREPFKRCHKGYIPIHTIPSNVCALVTTIVTLLLLSSLMVFTCLYYAHRKTVTKTTDDDQLTEPLSSQ